MRRRHQPRRRPRHARLLSLLLLLLPGSGLPGCGEGTPPPPPPPGHSAQSVVDALVGAARSDDVALFVSCFLPEQRAALSFGMGLMGALSVQQVVEQAGRLATAALSKQESAGSAERVVAMKEQLHDLLRKHGVVMDGERQRAVVAGDRGSRARILDEMLGHVDHAAFIADMHAYTQRHSRLEQPLPLLAGLVREYGPAVVSGDHAQAEISGARKPLRLVKRDGRWYADLDSLP